MNNLLPEGYEDEVITIEDIEDDKPIGYRNGLSFDEEFADFRRDGKNRIMDSDGIESWRSWVINCMRTERYKHLAYSSDFGIELDLVFGAESRDEAESILTRQITEAILADPYERTEYIDNIEIQWTAPDALLLSATLHGLQNVSIDVSAYLTNSFFPEPEPSEPSEPIVDYTQSSILGVGVLGRMILGSDGLN